MSERKDDGGADDADDGTIGTTCSADRQPEPADREVTAIEPSASMGVQRPVHLSPAVDLAEAPANAQAKACSHCGAAFACHAASSEACWCAALPPLALLSSAADCLCPTCLHEALVRQGSPGSEVVGSSE